MSGKTLLSFVIPCYRSEKTIEKVVDEIKETVALKADSYDYEIICVNDGSPDNVWSVLERLAAENSRVKAIDLSKNMGKHSAVMAGYSYVKGEYVVSLDDDCQCPVNELWRLLEPVEKNQCDFSTARYKVKKQSAFKNFGSNVNLWMSHTMLGKPRDIRFENFNIMKRYVMDEIINYKNPYPYLEGLILRITRRISMVDMEERTRGDDNASGFTLIRSLALWINGFTAFSVKPLRVSAVLGGLFAVMGFIFGIFIVVRKLIHPEIAAGYTSVMALLLFIGGVLMLILGIIGEYIGRIYICINNSPQDVVREALNIGVKEK